MKKLTIRSITRLLPFCFLLALGLMSCQQEEEIIPLEADDLVEGSSRFDISEATGIVIDENGKTTGYYDKEFNLFDKEGNPSSGSKSTSARLDDFRDPLVTLYDGPFFKGAFVTIYIHGADQSLQLPVNLSVIASGWRNRVESMVVSPDVLVSLDDSDAQYSQWFGNRDEDPHYYEELPGNLSNKVDFLQIERDPSSIRDGLNKLCGMLHESSGYGNSGAKIPFFKGHELDLSSLGKGVYDYTKISSLASNDDSDCNGVMLYEHVSDLNKDYYWADPDEDISSFSTHSSGFDNKTRRLVETPEVAHHERRLSKHKAVGAIIFSETGYKGDRTFFYKGDDYHDVDYEIGSFVVAPRTTFGYLNANIANSNWVYKDAGYYNSEDLSVKTININSSSTHNHYCGSLYNSLDTQNNPRISIFKGLTNATLPNGIAGINIQKLTSNDIANSVYSTTLQRTKCKGVTFYEFNNYGFRKSRDFDDPDDHFAWYPSGDAKTYPLPNSLQGKVKALNTEDCTPETTGANIYHLAIQAQLLNELAQSPSLSNRSSALNNINDPRIKYRMISTLTAIGVGIIGDPVFDYLLNLDYAISIPTAVISVTGTAFCFLGYQNGVLWADQKYKRLHMQTKRNIATPANAPYVRVYGALSGMFRTDPKNVIEDLLSGNYQDASLTPEEEWVKGANFLYEPEDPHIEFMSITPTNGVQGQYVYNEVINDVGSKAALHELYMKFYLSGTIPNTHIQTDAGKFFISNVQWFTEWASKNKELHLGISRTLMTEYALGGIAVGGAVRGATTLKNAFGGVINSTESASNSACECNAAAKDDDELREDIKNGTVAVPTNTTDSPGN